MPTDDSSPTRPGTERHTGNRQRESRASEGPGAALGELATQARFGREDAWQQIYALSYPRLYTYARRRLPTEEHALDAVSETMIRAVAGLDSWQDRGGGFQAWLYGILRHVVADEQRMLGRVLLSEEEPLERGDTACQPGQPGDELVEEVDRARVRQAFRLLSEHERELLYWRVLEELPVGEVARRLGRRPGAVRMAQSRALERLRQNLRHETGRADVRRTRRSASPSRSPGMHTVERASGQAHRQDRSNPARNPVTHRPAARQLNVGTLQASERERENAEMALSCESERSMERQVVAATS